MLRVLKNFARVLVNLNSESGASRGCSLFAELDGGTQRRELSGRSNEHPAGAVGMLEGMW